MTTTHCHCSNAQAMYDSTRLAHQTPSDWIEAVKNGYGELFANRCRELLPADLQMMSDVSGLNLTILDQVSKELNVALIGL